MEECLARLGKACLRVNEDLDFNTVLQGVLDSARYLAGARYGIIALHDDDRTPQDFLSSGMSTDETDRLWTLLVWPECFEYLGRNPRSCRHPTRSATPRSMGLPEQTSRAGKRM